MHEACRQRHGQREGLDLLLDFPQHLRPGLPPTTGEMRRPHRHHPNIADRPNTQTQRTDTLLETASHHEEPRISSENRNFLQHTTYLRNKNLSRSQQCGSMCVCVCVCIHACVRLSSPDCPGLHPEDPPRPSAWRRPGAH